MRAFCCYNNTLLLVALGALLDRKSLGAVVACAAELACFHVLHGHDIAALLHLEHGRMALVAFGCLVSVSAEDNLSRSLDIELNGLTRSDRKCSTCQYECDHNDQHKNHRLFHQLSPPFINKLSH